MFKWGGEAYKSFWLPNQILDPQNLSLPAEHKFDQEYLSKKDTP